MLGLRITEWPYFRLVLGNPQDVLQELVALSASRFVLVVSLSLPLNLNMIPTLSQALGLFLRLIFLQEGQKITRGVMGQRIHLALVKPPKPNCGHEPRRGDIYTSCIIVFCIARYFGAHSAVQRPSWDSFPSDALWSGRNLATLCPPV